MRNVILIIFFVLILIQGYFVWQFDNLQARTSALEYQSQNSQAELNKVLQVAQKRTEEGTNTASENIPDDSASTQQKSVVLLLSTKVDYLVDWISLVEDKIYFILAPPQDDVEKEKMYQDLKRRSEEIKSKLSKASLDFQEARKDFGGVTERSEALQSVEQ